MPFEPKVPFFNVKLGTAPIWRYLPASVIILDDLMLYDICLKIKITHSNMVISIYSGTVRNMLRNLVKTLSKFNIIVQIISTQRSLHIQRNHWALLECEYTVIFQSLSKENILYLRTSRSLNQD